MSTYLYLHCLSHDPPLSAVSESGQHLSDLDQIRRDIANRDELSAQWNAATWPDRGRSDLNATASFLAQHPHCRIGIKDEYGRWHPTEGDTPVSTADTIFGFVPFVARSVCEECGSRSVAVGPQAREVLAEAALVHDAECQDLREAARLLAAPISVSRTPDHWLFIEDVLAEETRRVRARVIWDEMRAALVERPARIVEFMSAEESLVYPDTRPTPP